MTTPEQIAANAASYAKRIGLNQESAAHAEIGMLIAALRSANDKLAQYTGITAKPQSGCHLYSVEWNGAEIVLEYEYEAGQLETWSDPAIPGSVSIIQALINGCWVDPDGLVAQDAIDMWAAEIYAARGERHQDDYEDDRIDAWLERQAEEAA